MAQGCSRRCVHEVMPVNHEMEQVLLDNAKLDKNIEEIKKMALLTKEECKPPSKVQRTTYICKL